MPGLRDPYHDDEGKPIVLPPLPPEEIARREERQAKRDRAERKARRDPYSAGYRRSIPTYSPPRPVATPAQEQPTPKPTGPKEGETDKRVLAGYKAAATRKANAEKEWAKYEQRRAQKTPPPAPTVNDLAAKNEEREQYKAAMLATIKADTDHKASDPPGTPTGHGLVALAVQHGITRDLHRAAQQIRAPWSCRQWTAAQRNTLAEILTGIITNNNAKAKKGQPK